MEQIDRLHKAAQRVSTEFVEIDETIMTQEDDDRSTFKLTFWVRIAPLLETKKVDFTLQNLISTTDVELEVQLRDTFRVAIANTRLTRRFLET